MTPLILSPRGPEVAKKQGVRANNKASVTFRAAAEAGNLLQKRKPSIALGMSRRTHRKMDQTYRSGRVFVQVDDDVEDHHVCPDDTNCKLCNPEYEPPCQWVMGNDELGQEPQEPVLASLLDIAQPARPKGVAKDFEVVDSVTRVIAFEDDVGQVDSDASQPLDDDDLWEEWDEAYRECDTIGKRKPLYSAVVEGTAQVDRPIEHICNDLCSGW